MQKIFLTGFILFSLIFNQESGVMGETSGGVKKGKTQDIETGGAILEFPQDHRFHFNQIYQSNEFIEWFYFTGILPDTVTGDEYGFFVCLYSVFPDYVGDFAFFFQIGINDPQNQETIFRDIPCPLAEIETGSSPGSDLTYWRFTSTFLTLTHWEESDIWELSADNAEVGSDRVAIELTMVNDNRDYFPETPSAVIEMGDCPGGEYSPLTMFGLSYYFTHPALSTIGTFHFRDNTRPVTGKTWMDRQWGNFNTCYLYYDWFSFRFDDGSYMMAWNFIDHNYQDMPDIRYLSYFPASGPPRYWYGKDAFSLQYDRLWASPESWRVYAVGQTISTPVGTFAVNAYYDDQENRGGVVVPEPFWEGMCRVYRDVQGGTGIGTAYLEMFRPPPAYNPVYVESGDYDGNGTSDLAIFRPSSGLWSIRGISRFYFGAAGDLPIPGDYNGDGTAEGGIFRPGSGLWAVRGTTRFYFGGDSDTPAPRDYNGDNACDPAFFRPESGLWGIRNISRIYFGNSSDLPVPGDYNGDGTVEIGIFRNTSALWAIREITRFYFGATDGLPVTGDYDGDGTSDGAVFRAATGSWDERLSSGGTDNFFMGSNGDIPVPGVFQGNNISIPAIFRPDNGLWAIRNLTRYYFGTSDDIPATR